MSYAVENALYQWQEGERRVREDPELEDIVELLVEELRKRLGSTFTLGELVELYGESTDWATELAASRRAGTDSAAVVDAAFKRYANEASNFAGGVAREEHERA